jgi:ribosomal-protein-alanine N-acetyltransferase
MPSVTITPHRHLSPTQRTAADALLTEIAIVDASAPPMFLDELPADSPNPLLFLAEIGADLIGLATAPPGREIEATIAVVPTARRQGIGRLLLTAIQNELRVRSIPTALLVADLKVPAARHFLAAVGAEWEEAEYRLSLLAPNSRTVPPHIPGLDLRVATPADASTLIMIQMEAFDRPAEVAGAHIAAGLAEKHRHFVLAEIAGDAVGMVRSGTWAGVGDITSLGVLPVWRGRGIGRALLLDAIGTLFASGLERVDLEVETGNTTALRLYESIGFRITAEYGYYRIASAG